MTPPVRPGCPKEWMASYVEKNRRSLEGRCRQHEAIDWSNPSALVGVICLGPLTDALVCFGALDQSLARCFCERGKWVLEQAIPIFGAAADRDAVDLDRPHMALSSRLGSILAPDLFGEPWPVPLDAFQRYVEADGRLLEEADAGRVLWALYALFEGVGDQYETARALKLRSHRDLRQEMAIVPVLAELGQDPSHPRWAEYEAILARWLNPILRTESYASNFQDMMAGLLALIWAKYRLGHLDRETLLATYFGETLSIPVVIE